MKLARGLRPLIAVGAVAVATLGLTSLANAVAPAADPLGQPASGPAAVSEVHSVRPSVLTPRDTHVTLAGTVRNTGDETVRNVQVLPRFSRHPIESRSDIRRVATDESLNWGARYDAAYDVVDGVLAPGESRSFSLEVPADLLGFGAAGVYVVGVDVMGSPADADERVLLHTSRTVLPWMPPGAELPSVPVAVLWPLTARPSLMPDGTLLDDSLAAGIGPGEPLTAIVDAAANAPVTWVIDPDLLDTAQVMADGYRVMSPSGPVEGAADESAAARLWLSGLANAARDDEMVFLPYANPDVHAMTAAAPQLADELSGRSLAASDERAAGSAHNPSVAAWLDSSAVNDQVLTTLAEAGAETAIVPSNAISTDNRQPRGHIDLGDDDIDTVMTDTGISDAIADTAAAGSSLAAAADVRQRWVAETAMVALQALADGRAPAPLVAAAPPRWRPDSATAEAVIDTWTSIPWVQPARLAEIGGAAEPPAVTPKPVDGANALPENNIAAAARLNDQAARYTDLLADADADDADGIVDGLALAAVRATSAGWRDDPAAGEAYNTTIADQLTGRFGRVSVTVPESVTLSSHNGSFPLTVTNELPQAVNVRLDIHSTNVDRLRVEDVPVERVEPGERRLVTVNAEAAANGKVPINVQLTTKDGSPLGPAQPTVVNATDYGTIGWVIMAGGSVLLAASLVRRGIRRRRQAAEETPAADTPATEPPAAAAAETEPAREAIR